MWTSEMTWIKEAEGLMWISDTKGIKETKGLMRISERPWCACVNDPDGRGPGIP